MPVDLLQQLIRFPSVSSESNVEVTEFAAERLAGLGFEVERVPYADARGVAKLNVAAVRPGRRTQEGGFAHFAHTDVVPAAEWTGPGGPFEPAVEGGRVYGRGSVDMKGSVAAMLAACERVTAHDAPVYVVLTGDEEAGMAGAEAVASRSEVFAALAAGGATGVIGEPTEGRVVHGHKGVAVWDLVAGGRAGHSATTEGESATLKLAPVLAEVRALADEMAADARWRDDRFDPPTPTLNLVVRDAAPALNVTSERAMARVLVRVSPDLDLAAVDDRLRAACEPHGVAFRPGNRRAAMFRPADSAAVRALCEVAGGRPSTVPYGTDGCCFGAVERLAVLGPGSINQAHTADEFIAVADLEAGAELYGRCIERFAG